MKIQAIQSTNMHNYKEQLYKNENIRNSMNHSQYTQNNV